MMKNSEIRALSTDDLYARLEAEKSAYDRMKFANDIAPIENPMRLKSQRRFIARLATEVSARKADAKSAEKV